MKPKPDGEMNINCDGKPVPRPWTRFRLSDGRWIDVLEVKAISSGSPQITLCGGIKATHRVYFRFIAPKESSL